MRLPPPRVQEDRPTLPEGAFHPRGTLPDQVLEDLRRDGAALLQGPPGSGTTWLAAEVARRWEGPVVWSRAGLFGDLADLARPAWDEHPDLLQTAPVRRLVDALADRLAELGALWVLDDFDEALEPPPGRAVALDAEVDLLLAALSAGLLRGRGAATLVVGRRKPQALDLPSRPLPPLRLEDAEALAGRPLGDADPAWLRRPGALRLLGALPPERPLPADPAAPWDELLEAFVEEGLDDPATIALFALAHAVHPAPVEALAAAVGEPPERMAAGLATLTRLRLAVPRDAGRRALRHVAQAARTVLEDRLPAVLPGPMTGRLAGWYLRDGQGVGRGWPSIDPALTSRLGARLAAAAGYGRMSLQATLHGGTARILEQHGGWRALRDDLGAGLRRRDPELTEADEVAARLLRAEAARRVADHEVEQHELLRAAGPADRSGNPALLLDVHGRLARRILLAGKPEEALEHLRLALVGAAAVGDRAAQSELHHQVGAVHLQAGRLEAAERQFERALGIAQQAEQPRLVASRKASLAAVVLYRGELRRAEELLLASIEEGQACGDEAGVSQRLLNVALIRSMRGDLRGAMRALGGAPADESAGGPRALARALGLRANLRRLAGDLPGAEADLARAEAAAVEAGDRTGVSELASVRAHLERTRGGLDAAVIAFDRALEALPPGTDPAVRAARRVEREAALALSLAAARLQGAAGAVDRLLACARRAGAELEQIPARPFFTRHLTAAGQVHAAGLLAADAAGTAPVGLARRLEQLLEEAAQDPERLPTGEPTLRVTWAWALWLVGDRERAREQARLAARQAGLASLATVRGRAFAVLGEADRIQDWNGEARLLLRLLHGDDVGGKAD